VVTSSASETIAIRGVTDTAATGLQIDVFSPDGTRTWSHTKPANEFLSGPVAFDGVTPTAVASRGKRFAVGGSYDRNSPWVQIYELP
jgi:hypothetical protein